MDRIGSNPKDSNVYSQRDICFNATPSGSHRDDVRLFYKHQIPSGLKKGVKNQ